jgi:transposase
LVVEEGFEHGYDSVKRYVRRLKRKAPEVFARLHTAPGEEAQVDFGEGAPTLKNGRYVRPWLFKLVLSYARHSYEEVVWGQDVETFIRCHERAFEALGGVPRIVLIDNLKSGVLKANLYEPELNPAYAAFAQHAGFVPLPCLPARPEHKGKTESGIGYTQDNALKGLRFDSLEAQNAHLRHWNRTWARTRIHGTTKKQVYAVFLEEEQAALQPVPLAAFAYFKVGQRKVHLDGHVEVERAYYSVPHRFVGETLVVHFNREYVKVLDTAGGIVAYHRTGEPGRFQTESHHLPESKSYSRETYKAHLLGRLRFIGPYARRWGEAVLKDRDALGLRALQGVVHLQRKHAPQDIDEACRKALHLGSLRYTTVARLVDDIDENVAEPAAADLLQEHPVLRPLSEYQLYLDGLDERT